MPKPTASGNYKYQVVVDAEMHEAISEIMRERGISKSQACRMLLLIGYDHYRECRALGIFALGDMIRELHLLWVAPDKAARSDNT